MATPSVRTRTASRSRSRAATTRSGAASGDAIHGLLHQREALADEGGQASALRLAHRRECGHRRLDDRHQLGPVRLRGDVLALGDDHSGKPENRPHIELAAQCVPGLELGQPSHVGGEAGLVHDNGLGVRVAVDVSAERHVAAGDAAPQGLAHLALPPRVGRRQLDAGVEKAVVDGANFNAHPSAADHALRRTEPGHALYDGQGRKL